MSAALRVGIDATALPRQPVGAGIYILNLVRALAGLAEACELVVFAQQHALPTLELPDRPDLQVIQVANRSRAGRLVWEQIALPWLARRQRLDLLHSPHYTMPLASPCPVVVTFHDMTFFVHPEVHTPLKRNFFRWAIRSSAHRARAFIAVSDHTRQDAIRLAGVAPGRIHTVPLGVSAEFRPLHEGPQLSAAQQAYRLPAKFLLYVGLVEPRKNLGLLLRAFDTLVRRGLAYDLVIAGSFGWMYQDVVRSAAASGLKGRVHFLGYVPRQDLPAIFNLADLFVYPSRYEGFGIPVLEAMACGTPVITTAVSSMPEVAGEAALLVPPDDQAALEQAIHRALSDESLREDLAHRGRQRAQAFTWERTARGTLAVYQQAVEAP